MDFDFSQLNLQYLIQARDLAKQDPELAAVIPFALRISAAMDGCVGVSGRGFDSMDAVRKPAGMYSRRPLTGTPAPKFDVRRVI
jgi:hypothetical protein